MLNLYGLNVVDEDDEVAGDKEENLVNDLVDNPVDGEPRCPPLTTDIPVNVPIEVPVEVPAEDPVLLNVQHSLSYEFKKKNFMLPNLPYKLAPTFNEEL